MNFYRNTCFILAVLVLLSPLKSDGERYHNYFCSVNKVKGLKRSVRSNNYPVKMSKKDWDVLVRCVSSESGYYYPDAYRVAQVILNRCVKQHKSVTEIVYQKKQFSGIGSRLWNSTDKKHMSKIRRICRKVFTGRIPCELKLERNILYFMNPKTAKGTWAAKMRKVKPVAVSKNNHHYYSE